MRSLLSFPLPAGGERSDAKRPGEGWVPAQSPDPHPPSGTFSRGEKVRSAGRPYFGAIGGAGAGAGSVALAGCDAAAAGGR
jgi:hypothetical protein